MKAAGQSKRPARAIQTGAQRFRGEARPADQSQDIRVDADRYQRFLRWASLPRRIVR